MNFNKLISGRMDRAPFWGYVILIWVARKISKYILLIGLEKPSALSAVLVMYFLIDLLLTLILTCAMIKRLHDLNWPTFLAFLPLIGYTLSLPSILGVISGRVVLLGAILGWVTIALLICCLFLKGDKGPNKYGPDPLEQKAN